MFRFIVIILLAFWGIFLFRSCQEADTPKNLNSESSVSDSKEANSQEWQEVGAEENKNNSASRDENTVKKDSTKSGDENKPLTSSSDKNENYVTLPKQEVLNINPVKVATPQSSVSRDSYVKVYLYDNRIDTFGDGVLTGRVNFEVINMSRFAQSLSIVGVKDLGRVKMGETTYMGFEALEAGDYVLMSKNVRGTLEQNISVLSE